MFWGLLYLLVWIHELYIYLQDAIFNSSNIELMIYCVRSVKDVGTRNHGFLLIASVAKACPELVSENIVDLCVVIGDAIKQVCVCILFW
jgi:hypothetical protein